MRVRDFVFRHAAVLLALSALVLAVPALAEDGEDAAEPQTPDAGQATVEQAPAAAAGMVAYIDPETGGHSYNPTEAQRAALRAALAAELDRSTEGLFEVVLPNGSIMVDLQGRFQHAVAVFIAPDGTLRQGCFADVEAATAAPVASPDDPPAAVVATE